MAAPGTVRQYHEDQGVVRHYNEDTAAWPAVTNRNPLPVAPPLNPVSGSAHNDGENIAAAVTLTPPAGASRLLIQSLGQNARFTLDGTTPTASKGFQLKAGDPPVVIPIGANTVIKVIQEAATADLQYQWCY